MTLKLTQDSNSTGLRVAEEQSYKVPYATPVWEPQEPNSYADFGGDITTTPRAPINADRQRKKGPTTDLEAAAGWESDLTQENMQQQLQGFFFADLRRKADVGLRRRPLRAGTAGENADFTIVDIDTTSDEITVDSRIAASAAVAAGGTGYSVGDVLTVTNANATITAQFTVATAPAGVVGTVTLLRQGRAFVDSGVGAATTGGGGSGCTLTVTYANGLTWAAGDLLFISGLDDAANNGLKLVSSVANNVLTTVENLVTDASPASTARMTTVGHQFAADDLNVVVSAAYPTITSDATYNFTLLGLVPGEWIYVGGDTSLTKFAEAANNGFARVRSVTATAITLDKTQNTMVSETLSGSKTVRLFFGRVLKNETGTNIRRRTYEAERTLGAPDDAQPTQIQAEYVVGCFPNEFKLKIPESNKVTCDLMYLGADVVQRTAAEGVKAGTRPDIEEASAFNTSSDFKRTKMAVHSLTDAAPTPLFAFVLDLNFGINNNGTVNKAVGVLGGFEVTAGNFEVSGDMEVYFGDVGASQAVRNNANVTLDAHLVKENAGISIDMPLISLGDGKPNVAPGEAIKLPLNADAASGALIDPNLNHTLLMVFWDYLPDAAAA